MQIKSVKMAMDAQIDDMLVHDSEETDIRACPEEKSIFACMGHIRSSFLHLLKAFCWLPSYSRIL